MKTHKEKSADGSIVEFLIPADLAYISEIRAEIIKACRDALIKEDVTQDVCLAIIEAVTNSIRYSKCKELTVSLSFESMCVVAKVVDRGNGFSFSEDKCRFPSIDSPGGRGLPIISVLVDQLTVDSRQGRGTSVTMVKQLT